MLYELIETYGKVGQSGRNDDDVFDRFSHRWTIILLAIFIITLTAKQFVGVPIECIAPSNFEGHHKTYVENFCWIHYTYSIDESTALTRDFVRGANGSRRTPYYIWIPYILIVAALCTYLPAWLWHVVGHRLTFDIPAMINQIAKTNLTDTEERQKNLLALAKHYHRAHRYTQVEMKSGIHVVRKLISIGMFFAGGGMLTGTYFFIKLCYLFNAIGQFMLMNSFLRIDYWSYGQSVALGLVRGSDWLENKIIFPRIVFCDFTIRYLGDNNPNYTVQCTLPVNLYNERIFAFYWFWLVFLALVTAYGIVHWLFEMSYRNRRSFLKKHLRLGCRWRSTDANRKLFPRFIDTYLGGDGILFLRLVSKNTSPVITGELLGLMWKQFEENERALKEVKVFQVDTFLNGRETVKTD